MSGPGWARRGWVAQDPAKGLAEGDIIIYHDGDSYNGVVRGKPRGHVGIAGMHNGRMMLWSHMGTRWQWTEIGRFSEVYRQPGPGGQTQPYGPPSPSGTPAPGAPVQMGSTAQAIDQARQGQRQAAVTYERRVAHGPRGESMTVTVPQGQSGSHTIKVGGITFLVRFWADGRTVIEGR